MIDRERLQEMRASGIDPNSVITADDLHEISGKLIAMGGKVILIKCGMRGIYVRTAEEEKISKIAAANTTKIAKWANQQLWHPSFHIDNFAGATGSGDSSIAGFLTAFLRRYSPLESIQMACAAGAFNVTAPDALSGLRSWDEMLAAVKAGWKTNDLVINEPGWQKQPGGWWIGAG